MFFSQLRAARTNGCVVAAIILIIFFGGNVESAELSPSEEERLNGIFAMYVKTQELNPPIPVEYGRRLIPDLIRLLNADQKVPDLERLTDLRQRRFAIVKGLIRAIKMFEGYEEATVGRVAIYNLIDNAELPIRLDAMRLLVSLDGEAATNVWLKILRDPDETMRTVAATLLGAHGRLNATDQIEQILLERSQGFNSEQIKSDLTIKFGKAAIEELQERASGKTGPSTSERVNAQDLIERGSGSIRSAAADPIAVLKATTETNLPVAVGKQTVGDLASENSTFPDSVSTISETWISTSVLLWTSVVVTIVLLVVLVFYWVRRA